MADENVAPALSTYVVQRLMANKGQGDEWQDVTTVEVPPRTRRPTILRQALGEVPIAGDYRVLDAESAAVMPAQLKEQPPQLVIG